MNNAHKIKLQNMEAEYLSKDGKRIHKLIPIKRPYQLNNFKRKSESKHAKSYSQRVFVQLGISVAVCISVLIISSIDTDVFNQATQGIEYVLHKEGSLEESFSVFKGMLTGIDANDAYDFALPTDGQYMNKLKDIDGKIVGMIFSSDDKKCYACLDGVVFYVDRVSASDPYLRIRHDDGIDTLYMGVISDVKTGDIIKKGQVIGECVTNSMALVALDGNDYILFEEMMDK